MQRAPCTYRTDSLRRQQANEDCENILKALADEVLALVLHARVPMNPIGQLSITSDGGWVLQPRIKSFKNKALQLRVAPRFRHPWCPCSLSLGPLLPPCRRASSKVP